ncbi:MAG: flagellar hook capping FlgD N-terminal domain-containing protein [Paracoccaceae bacterium]
MEVQPATPTGQTATTQPKRASAITSDFNDFIELLTAQAKYQDPLEPINSTDYVAQLAQFSTVEQQVLTNELMSQQIDNSLAGTVASLSSWIGMEAQANAPARFDGSAITVVPAIAPNADSAQLVVYNSAGVEVQRTNLGLDGQRVTWQGYDADTGSTLPFGSYSFAVDSFNGSEKIESTPADVFTRVNEAQLSNGQVTLILESGASVSTGDIRGIREPA